MTRDNDRALLNVPEYIVITACRTSSQLSRSNRDTIFVRFVSIVATALSRVRLGAKRACLKSASRRDCGENRWRYPDRRRERRPIDAARNEPVSKSGLSQVVPTGHRPNHRWKSVPARHRQACLDDRAPRGGSRLLERISELHCRRRGQGMGTPRAVARHTTECDGGRRSLRVGSMMETLYFLKIPANAARFLRSTRSADSGKPAERDAL
jgi:hypothetical protein